MRTVHNVTTKTKGKIICGQGNCTKIYYSGYAYKRHLDSDHNLLNEVAALQGPNSPQQLPQQEAAVIDTLHEDNQEDTLSEVLPRSSTEIGAAVKDAAASFIADFKSSSLPTCTVQRVIEGTSELIHNIVCAVEEVVSPIIKDANDSVFPSKESIENIQSTLQLVKDPFSNLATEYQQKRHAREKGALVEPVDITLGYIHKQAIDSESGRTQQDRVAETFQYIPIEENLKTFFERPGCISSIIQYKQKVSDENILETYRDGLYYKQSRQANDGEVTIELLLYTDEFETTNPLGSKKGQHKLLGVYLTVLCLHPKYQAKLDNILLVALAKSTLVSKYGLDSIFSPIVRDLETLSVSGINVECEGYKGTVKPKLFQIIGDNLAMNTVLGYAGSFTANYFCRFCKTKKQITYTQVVEDQDSLRTYENIEHDLGQNALPLTGLARSSVFNNLNYFHVSHNATLDIMHDFLEGLLPIELKLVLKEFIFDQELFSLDLINSRIGSFSYGFNDQKNRPCPLTQSQLNNPFGSSGQKASQMQCLALFLPLMIGDKVPNNNKNWELFITLLEIYKVVCSPVISIDGTYYLKSKIKEHHTLFLELFPERHLIPKAHNLLHYPRAIRMLGPLHQYTCMRLEAKHNPLKQWARTCYNYKNIAKTLASKHQTEQAYKNLGKQAMDSTSIEIQSQTVTLASLLDHADIISNLVGCPLDTELIVCKTVIVNGYMYRCNVMILIDWKDDLPVFAKVVQIVSHESELHLILQPWDTLYFDDHYQAYAVKEKRTNEFQVMRPDGITEHRPFHTCQNYERSDHSWYIVTRYNMV